MATGVDLHSKAFISSYVDSVAQQNQSKHSPLVRVPTSFTYVDNSWNWSTYNYISVPHSHSSDEQNRNRTACILGTIVTFVAAGIFGFAAKSWKMNAASLKETREIKQAAFEKVPKVMVQLFSLTIAQEKVDQINMSRSNHYVVAATMTLLGGAVLLIGGLTSTSALITAGSIVAIAGIAFGLGSVCYHCSDSQDIRKIYDKHHVDTKIVNLNAELDKYDDEMTILPLYAEAEKAWLAANVVIGANIPPPPYQAPVDGFQGYQPVSGAELEDDTSDSDVETGHPFSAYQQEGEGSSPVTGAPSAPAFAGNDLL